MAKDDNEDRYKEGEDFEWVKAKGSNYRTRRFFSKAEKRARAEKKETAKAATDDKPTGSTPKARPQTKPKPRPKAAPTPTKGPDDGSRAGQTRTGPGAGTKSGASRSTSGKVKPKLRSAGSGTPSDPMTQTGSLKIPDKNSSGSIPISNPNRALAEQRREDERRARAEAEAQGGRVSPLGRMIDRIFDGSSQSSTGGGQSKKRPGGSSARGLNKGGMIMTNKGKVGASMVPTQKKFRTQSRKGK